MTKIELVKMMHETIKAMNNEMAYEEWIYIMPDEPDEDDFEWFAENEEEFDHLVNVYVYLMEKYLKDGLYFKGKLYTGLPAEYYEEEVYEERRGFITNPVVEIVKRDGRSDEGIIMPHDYVYNEGDILYLLKMPFDHDGHHATGRAIWKRGSWVTEYEED